MNRIAGVVILVLITLLFHWRRDEFSYQTGDAGTYLITAQEIHVRPGLLEKIEFAYLERPWKPIVFPLLLTPFLALENGDTRQAFKSYRTFLSPFLSAGIFLLISLLIPQPSLAFLAALILNCAPWLLTSQIEFGTELPWLTLSVWTLYFILRGKLVTSAVFLSLTAMVRPLEAAITLGLPFAANVLKKSGRWKFVLFESAAFTILAVIPYLFLGDEYPPGARWAIAAAVLLYAAYKWKMRDLLWTAPLIALILWYLPGFWKLFDWTWKSTQNPLSIGLTDYQPWTRDGFVPGLVFSMGPVLLLPGLLALCRLRRLNTLLGEHKVRLRLWLWMAMAFPFLAAFSSSRDMRYQYFSFIALFLVGFYAMTVAYSKRSATIFAVAVLALQAFGALPLYAFESWARRSDIWHSAARYTGDQSGVKPTLPETAFEDFFDQLAALPIRHEAKLLFVQRREFEASHNATNPARFQLRAFERGLRWRIVPFAHTENRAESDANLVTMALSLADTFLIGPPGEDLMASKDWQPARTAEILLGCAERGCAEWGLRLLGRLNLKASPLHPEQSYLVFEKADRT